MIAAYIDGEPVEMTYTEAVAYNREHEFPKEHYYAQWEHYINSCDKLYNTQCPKCNKTFGPCGTHGRYHMARILASGIAYKRNNHGQLIPDHLSTGPYPYIAKDWRS